MGRTSVGGLVLLLTACSCRTPAPSGFVQPSGSSDSDVDAVDSDGTSPDDTEDPYEWDPDTYTEVWEERAEPLLGVYRGDVEAGFTTNDPWLLMAWDPSPWCELRGPLTVTLTNSPRPGSFRGETSCTWVWDNDHPPRDPYTGTRTLTVQGHVSEAKPDRLLVRGVGGIMDDPPTDLLAETPWGGLYIRNLDGELRPDGTFAIRVFPVLSSGTQIYSGEWIQGTLTRLP